MNPQPFTKMGASVQINRVELPGLNHRQARLLRRRAERVPHDASNSIPGLSVDVREGEFLLNVPDNVDLVVLQADPKDRHLLLMARDEQSRINCKFLCGHDERDWFVAAVPRETVSLADAKDRLMPLQARRSQERHRVRGSHRHRRHNKGFVRQGEWFFVPVENLDVDPKLILAHEPLTRGGGSKPHIVEQLYRLGGELVYVHQHWAPVGITARQFHKLPEQKQKLANWRQMRRNPEVYAKGRVRHADHATVKLHDWHRVHMNREVQTQAVAFLD